MIGVISKPEDQAVVREFFELFKTPWEFYRPSASYEILLCADDVPFETEAGLILFYAGRGTEFDTKREIRVGQQFSPPIILRCHTNRIPIYGETVVFPDQPGSLLTVEGSERSATFVQKSSETALVRLGYDLFSEIRFLLTIGQPPENARIPTVELHIDLLRDLIARFGAPLAEIPPVPEGYQCIVCLTHDIDHPLVRTHKIDHTVLGFLFRAALGSVWDLARGEISLQVLIKNWEAVLALPLVHLGLVKDFWNKFDDRYLDIEKGLRSTFFVIPFGDYPGKKRKGTAPTFRASRYGAKDIAASICKLIAAGCEVGLHGLDAWLVPSSGKKELAEIRDLTGAHDVGVRMHWLYYDQDSPAALENAGAAYDSTVGYNETVGYRAGTTQVYKPLSVRQLLELPLHAMDTALFYKSYLGLTSKRAGVLLNQLAENAVRFGGSLTINWHDRSVVPERLWIEPYHELIRDLEKRGAWFATAAEAVSWFRKRRLATFKEDNKQPGNVRAEVAVEHDDNLPGLRLRVHHPSGQNWPGPDRSGTFTDLPIEQHVTARV